MVDNFLNMNVIQSSALTQQSFYDTQVISSEDDSCNIVLSSDDNTNLSFDTSLPIIRTYGLCRDQYTCQSWQNNNCKLYHPINYIDLLTIQYKIKEYTLLLQDCDNINRTEFEYLTQLVSDNTMQLHIMEQTIEKADVHANIQSNAEILEYVPRWPRKRCITNIVPPQSTHELNLYQSLISAKNQVQYLENNLISVCDERDQLKLKLQIIDQQNKLLSDAFHQVLHREREIIMHYSSQSINTEVKKN
jgi:hypothetical protein